ncbi:unnamed protein product [Hydatigera taeniaeformis]|uniref:Uncharacterized protein n=1 Tax=Hydatigena taeniaeformis TaxID=6205 RepID=A0A0R3XCN8_HYDTA|nr:unnamed protein product [Hydatigera taeniaeformis]
MRSQSTLACFLILLLAFTSYQVVSLMAPDSQTAKQLEEDLFDTADLVDGEEALDDMETEYIGPVDEADTSDSQDEVLVPAGWRRFRRRLRRAFRRVRDGIRRVFREPWRVCLGRCNHGRKPPVPLTF